MQTPANPYSPPMAAVADQISEPPGRPALVWIIVALIGLGSLGSIVSLVLRVSGRIPDIGGLIHELYWYDHVVAAISTCVWVVAAIALFRLKRVAWPLFGALFAMGIAVFFYHWAAKPAYRAVLGQTGYWGAIGGMLLNAAIVYYVYRLRRDGVLRN